jgi:hypothetical protein
VERLHGALTELLQLGVSGQEVRAKRAGTSALAETLERRVVRGERPVHLLDQLGDRASLLLTRVRRG